MGGDGVSDFLAGGGEMGALTRAFDWSTTPIGSPDTWPQSLRVTVRLVLTSRHPMFIWWGPDLIQFYNDAYRATMGPERHPSALGARGRECWAEIWDIIGPQIEYVMSGQGATWHEDQLVPVTRHGRREDVWWTYSFGPIDLDGKVGGVLVVCKDVTSEHMGREALHLINEELKHRVKNTLAVLSAVAAQTFRDPASKSDLEKYQARLAAFGRAHDLLTAANWAAAPLQDVIDNALMPHRTGESRFAVTGPSLVVKSRQALALSLAIHELATNALKYGALTAASGHVSITWTAGDQDGEPKFVFVWQEFGGPMVAKPDRAGFGSRLISRVLEDDFRGEVEVSYDATGLVCRLTAPLETLATS
ncbi:PAS domain-containing protein [Bradyrhizobium diazoefficiens]|nr:PAS domain-containing sensor histidine kinase [Bradyrhizobium diazoefficiens]UCF55376.1 MAG: PAS domain-containing protein [Bradyrhizobium sp.]MBR0967496.1 PAS domain-containing protein [Bradyrhizobium diazoefficiens]MBR0980890.1 PAS domain-containing protein [Bradyrhizobium diazoefficiens]MBR1010367.1 PAS domain-containing protein [Bradyrhizobium diazoefficiens]MBR1017023.1 PAS domain-containing protein [Bradyrhizobium diazoefficiens]